MEDIKNLDTNPLTRVSDGKPIRILLIDDHTLFRSGVKALLQRQPDFIVVGEASDGLEGVKLVEQVEADIVLLDVDMPSMNGPEALAQILETHPKLPVLMLTVSEDCDVLGECLKLGARGYLLKNIDQDFLLRSIRSAKNGVNVLSPQMMAKYVHTKMEDSEIDALCPPKSGLKRPETPRSLEDEWQLTRRELQTLAWLAKGFTNKGIARELDLSESTVKVHVQSILRKLELNSRVQAAIFAVEHHIDRDYA